MTAIQIPNKVADLIRNDAPAAEARNALGMGSIATHDEGEFEPAGAASSITAEQLGVYTISQVDILVSERQPVNGDLAALAALTGTGFARRTGTDTWTVGALAAGDIPDLSATYSVVSHTHTGLSTAIAPGSLWGGQGSGVPAAVAIGSGLSLAGGTLTATGGGGGGGLAVGSAVSGGGANRVLYEDGSQALATSADLTFASGILLTGSTGPKTAAVGVESSSGFPGLWLNSRTPDLGMTAGVYWNATYGRLMVSTGSAIVPIVISFPSCTMSWIEQDHMGIGGGPGIFSDAALCVSPRVNTSPALVTHTQAGATKPHYTLRCDSSTASARNAAAVDAIWADSTDATRKGRLTLHACDSTGTDREGLRVESDGLAALLSFFGGPAAAKPTVSGSRGGNAALQSLLIALANLGLINDSTSA